MFQHELEKYASKLDCFSSDAVQDKFSRGFEFISEPESVMVGLTAPALGVAPEYDDLKRKVIQWEGIRSANSLGLRSAVIMKDGQLTGEKSLRQVGGGG